MKRRPAAVIDGADGRSVRDEPFDRWYMSLARRDVQCALQGAVRAVHVGAVLEQQLHDVDVAVVGRFAQRTAVVLSLPFGVVHARQRRTLPELRQDLRFVSFLNRVHQRVAAEVARRDERQQRRDQREPADRQGGTDYKGSGLVRRTNGQNEEGGLMRNWTVAMLSLLLPVTAAAQTGGI